MTWAQGLERLREENATRKTSFAPASFPSSELASPSFSLSAQT